MPLINIQSDESSTSPNTYDEEWVKKHPFVFHSQVEALKKMLPEVEHTSGIEIGIGTGIFTKALGIKQEIDLSPDLPILAQKQAILLVDGGTEQLPYKDFSLNFILMVHSTHYFHNLPFLFTEVHRILQNNGVLVTGFFDYNNVIKPLYDPHKPGYLFNRQANFLTVEKVVFDLNCAGFKQLDFCQTLFRPLEQINSLETSKPGYGEGSFIVVQAQKKKDSILHPS
jgi:ubiquinone/menaquinone biosynthesis C-methylase UbiE